MGSKGTRPPEPGTSKGQIKETYGNGPGGRGQAAYWEWNGSSWIEISKDVFDKGGSRGAADATAVAANTTTYQSTSKRYPQNIDYTGADYMIFEFFEYTPPFSKERGAAITLKNYNYSGIKDNLKKAAPTEEYPQIVLYMPEGVSASYKANWDGKKFGNIAAGILSSYGDIIGKGGSIGSAFKELAQTGDDATKRAGTQLGANAISAIIGGITGDSVTANDIFSATSGQILNPNAELIFGGHDLRTFTFTYRLVPFNETEAESIFGINGIINTFKKALLPSFAGSTAQAGIGDFANASSSQKYGESIGFIKNPKIVQPYFMNGNSRHPFLPALKPCTITDFDVNYTADGVYAAHAKGYPAAAEITINLTETKLLYSEDINQGY